jgi:twitching motility protein PilT
MSDRNQFQGYRLRKLVLELGQFTVDELSAIAGTDRGKIEQFIFKLKKEIPGIFELERLAPAGVGKPPSRYRVSAPGMRELASKNVTFGRELRDLVSPKPIPTRAVVSEVAIPEVIAPRVVRPEVNVGSWINSLRPAFAEALLQGAHLVVRPSEPITAQFGRLVKPLAEALTLTADEILEALKMILTPWQQARLEKQGWTAGAYALENHAPVHLQVETESGKPTIRLSPLATRIPTPTDLRLPALAEKLSLMRSGLILITGIPRSGRSATMAALVNSINTGQSERIATIEEPVHYFYPHAQSFLEQKQVAIDAPDFGPALGLVLRNDADVIALSAVSDPQTFSTVLEAAERNLVFCKVFAASPGEAIANTIGMFPGEEQIRIRSRLAQNLAGIISVKGLPEISGEGRAVAAEVLEWRPELHGMILDPERTSQISEAVVKCNAGESFQDSVQRLYEDGRVSEATLTRFVASRSA